MSGAPNGFFISAFLIGWMIGNPRWGGLFGRLELRAGMTAAVSFWTLAPAAHKPPGRNKPQRGSRPANANPATILLR